MDEIRAEMKKRNSIPLGTHTGDVCDGLPCSYDVWKYTYRRGPHRGTTAMVGLGYFPLSGNLHVSLIQMVVIPANGAKARLVPLEPCSPDAPNKALGSTAVADPDKVGGGGDVADDALNEALGGGSGGSVYLPPKPGGSAAALPEQVSDSQITERIKGRFESLAACGEKNPGVDGVVVMRWGVTPEGGARDVKCAAPCASQPLATCIGSVIEGIRFPLSVSGRSRVEFPFKF